jgi:hypothetical protein
MSVNHEATQELPPEFAAWREQWQAAFAAEPAGGVAGGDDTPHGARTFPESATAEEAGSLRERGARGAWDVMEFRGVSATSPVSGARMVSGLRERVERQSRRQRLLVAGDVLVTLLMGGGATAWALRDPRPAVLVLTAAVWAFLTAAWIFAMTNRRGTWAPASVSTAAFLDLSIRRCRGSLATIRFGLLLGAMELLFSLAWVYQDHARRDPVSLTSRALLVVWAAGAAALAGLILYRRRKRAELSWLLDLRRQLSDADADAEAEANASADANVDADADADADANGNVPGDEVAPEADALPDAAPRHAGGDRSWLRPAWRGSRRRSKRPLR